ncbi:hypothetical protein [Galbitalea soli]|uniref:DUF4214 domain-containing protein n=1 Tax=Galbitalea soli TaxID=1268042 RepID=A0A7C9TRX6_9MICO|nr:hypothetical protein [Galbitalea soli]NEM91343.1 hypothetical protein [Galbitalea soli]NYJ30033.1 hypothetical protein [Galbitalea soli]
MLHTAVHTLERGVSALLRRARPLAATAAIAALLSGVALVSPLASESASAAPSPSEFQRGNLISDAVMFYSTSMTPAQIQSFLNLKGASCTTMCLKDFHMDTVNFDVPTTGGYIQHVCAPYQGAKNESAATIIWKVAQYCHVNPQAIIVTLQKEQGLVTRTASTSLTYRKAMGYGCSDTAACASQYYGFFRQVFWGARAFARPVSNYLPGRTVNVLINPNRACGYKSITIANKATSNLYTYTPYTPDNAALANLYGSGDSCSSYGNRNFWRYFNDWFGSSVIPQATLSFVQADYMALLGRGASQNDQYRQGKFLLAHPSRVDFTHSLIVSTEYRNRLVSTSYQSVLGRAPTATELSSMVSAVIAGRVKQNAVVPTLLKTAEYYRSIGQDNTPGFLTALFQFTIGRAPHPAEIATFEAKLAKVGRGGVVDDLWNNRATQARVAAAGYALLFDGAQPSPTQLTAFSANMAKYGYSQALCILAGGNGYFAWASTKYPTTD